MIGQNLGGHRITAVTIPIEHTRLMRDTLRVTSLHHKLLDHPVEQQPLVGIGLTEPDEILLV